MKSISSLTAIALTLASLLPAVSMAQPDGRRGDDRPPMAGRDRPEPARREGPPPRPDFGGRRDMRGGPDQREVRNQEVRNQDGRDDRGAGPEHAFRRGGRLPPDYRSRQYVVDDWRGHHLNAPPRGYQWVQTGADYVLVAVATGLIAQVLLGN